jgi:hypothetical protein
MNLRRRSAILLFAILLLLPILATAQGRPDILWMKGIAACTGVGKQPVWPHLFNTQLVGARAFPSLRPWAVVTRCSYQAEKGVAR